MPPQEQGSFEEPKRSDAIYALKVINRRVLICKPILFVLVSMRRIATSSSAIGMAYDRALAKLEIIGIVKRTDSNII